MKKIVLIIAFVATIFSAQAWTKVVDDASYLIAEKYMTEAAKTEYNRILGLKESSDYKWVDDKLMRASLNAELCSVTTDEKDIVVRIEKATEVLRNRANHSAAEQYKALLTLQKLLPELHTISRIAIEGIEPSQSDFEITWSAGKEGSKKHEKRGKTTWHRIWSNSFCFWHQGWSSEYYAYDINLRFGKLREQAMQGGVRDWAHEMGLRAKPLYDWVSPGMLMRHEPRLILEDTHLEMVARAGYRLAALLNECLK